MSFPTNIYFLPALAAFLAALFSLPLWRAWCRRCGHVDDPGHRKIHTDPIPLAGGLAILTALLLPLLALAVALPFNYLDAETAEKIRYGFAHRVWQLGTILFGAVGMAVLGWLDDKHELRDRKSTRLNSSHG